MVGLCPFHPDKETKSLTVYPDNRGWYCFGCGQGGGVIQFLMARGMTYQQVVKWCKLQEGRLPEPKFKPRFGKSKKLKPSHQVVDYWHGLLGGHREYFQSRLLVDETIDRYKLGWTGQRFSIPFWEGSPGNSKVQAVQSRRCGDSGPKYRWELGSHPHVFDCSSGQGRSFIFFSTLDALLAAQDGLEAMAVPGQTVGMSSKSCWETLSRKVTDLLGFRDMVVVPDRGEEYMGYRLAHLLSCEVFEWPNGDYSDYCEFRLHYGPEIFKKFVGGNL